MNIPGIGTTDIYSSEAKIMQYNCEILRIFQDQEQVVSLAPGRNEKFPTPDTTRGIMVQALGAAIQSGIIWVKRLIYDWLVVASNTIDQS